MDLVKIISMLGGVALSACSIGTDWSDQHYHVPKQTEIPLHQVPWTSACKQAQEAHNIFPTYLALKKEQECEAKALDCAISTIGHDESS